MPTEAVLPTPQDLDRISDTLQVGECAFLVIGQRTPTVLRDLNKIVLGRYVPGEPAPTLDLSVNDGVIYGVSRQHAVIKRVGKGYTVEDMESRNGTWINERRLRPHEVRPLKSGDLLRLGQLGVYVYFKEIPVTPVCSVVLEDESSPHGINLTPEYLRDVVSPYLMALAQVQEVVQQMHGRAGLLMVKSITAQAGSVAVILEYAEEAVQFVETSISTWRTGHEAELRHMLELNDLAQWMLAEDAQERIYVKREQHRRTLQPELLQLALKFLDRVSKGTLHLGIASHIDRLIAAFWIIALSPLRVKQVAPETIP